MKKTTSILIAAIFITLFTLTGCSSETYTTTTESTENIQCVSISASGYSIEISQGTGSDIEITCPNSEEVISIDGDTLNIVFPENTKIMLTNPAPIKIVLPQKQLQLLKISADAGEIQAQGFQARETNIFCEAGTVTIIGTDGVYTGKTHAGDYTLPNHFNIEGTELNSSFSGSIGDFEGTIYVETVTGEIIIK